MHRTVYLDYNATTPLDPGVHEAMLPFFGEAWGNPSSVHHVGRRARALLDDFRDRVAKLWRAKPTEVVFTSGGTESNNLAIFGAARHRKERGRHLISSPTEHHAVLHPLRYLQQKEGFDVTWLPVDRWGRVNPDDLKRALRPDTTLVSVMTANNETGTIQPVAELGALCRERGVLFHTDAVQAFGKLPFENIHQFNADLVSVCAHKFHGPKGAGALFIRSPLLPDPVQFGGAHENERRAGTENLPAIAGLVAALERFVTPPVFSSGGTSAQARRLRAFLEALDKVSLWSPAADCLPNTVSVSVSGSDSISLLAGLDLEGVCASSGSACTAGSLESSHVLVAQGATAEAANALLRFSLGRENTAADLDRLEAVLPKIVSRARL